MKDILNECASLRGVESVPWRTVAEFAEFTAYVVQSRPEKLIGNYEPYREKYLSVYKTWSDEDHMENCAKLFLEYCQEVYGNFVSRITGSKSA